MIQSDINRERLLKTFVSLLRINSPSYSEKVIGTLLKKMLIDRGCRVSIQKYDKTFNIIAVKKGNTPGARPILVSGHMDTIEPTDGICFRISADRIVSTGSTVLGADDKSGLAQILEARKRTCPMVISRLF